MFAKSDEPRAFCMKSREFTQTADGMPFVCNGRTFLKIDGWALPVTQLGRAGINLTETYLNQPSPICLGDTTSISCNNIETDIPKILNSFVKDDRNRVNLKTECDSLKSELVQTKSELAEMKSHLDTAEKRSLSVESHCTNLESQLNSKDIELNFKTQQIARLQADAQPTTSSRNFLLSPKVIVPVSTIAVLEVAAIQTSNPKLAPSYWCGKAWAAIFSSSDANLSQPEKETETSKIGLAAPILEVSVNPEFKEYRRVQVQSVVSPTPPNGLIRSSQLISLFSFIL